MINPFTFLKEHNIFDMLHSKVLELFENRKEDLKELIEKYISEKSPSAKTALLNFFVKHVKLKFPYSLFKGMIKKSIEKNFDKLVSLILEKVKEI